MEYREFSEKWLDSSTRFIEDGKRAWERYVKAASDEKITDLKAEDLQKEFMKFAQHEGPETIAKVMKISADYYFSLFDTALEFNQKTADALYGSHRTADGMAQSEESVTVSENVEPAVSNIDLYFKPIKRRIQNEAFVIANKKEEDIDVSFEVSELICEDGKHKLAAPVNFKPNNFLLKPGDEQVVECRMKLTRSLEENQEYAALARVVGFKDLYLRIIITPE